MTTRRSVPDYEVPSCGRSSPKADNSRKAFGKEDEEYCIRSNNGRWLREGGRIHLLNGKPGKR